MQMPHAYVRPTTWDDCLYLKDRLRPNDVLELGMQGIDTTMAAICGKALSNVCLTLIDKHGEPAGLLGTSVDETTPGWGNIWMYGTPLIDANPMTFLRYSRPTLKYLCEKSKFEVLWNYVHAHNTLHIKWLEWLGFSFLRTVYLKPYHEPYIEFLGTKGSTCVSQQQP